MSAPKMYRKKSFPVGAYLWQGESFAPSHVPPGTIHSVYQMLDGSVYGQINTSEGPVNIIAGNHYIVGPGVGDEFWPVHKDIFERVYELVDPE